VVPGAVRGRRGGRAAARELHHAAEAAGREVGEQRGERHGGRRGVLGGICTRGAGWICSISPRPRGGEAKALQQGGWRWRRRSPKRGRTQRNGAFGPCGRRRGAWRAPASKTNCREADRFAIVIATTEEVNISKKKGKEKKRKQAFKFFKRKKANILHKAVNDSRVFAFRSRSKTMRAFVFCASVQEPKLHSSSFW
jgi:hypothetical protein